MSQSTNLAVQPTGSVALQVSQPYALGADKVLAALRTQEEGLVKAEATNRLRAIGPNRLPAPPKEGVFKRFFKHFNDVIIYILLVAGVAKACLGHWVDASVILAVAIINAVVGFIQEGRAEQALEGIRKMLSLRAQARRDGEWLELDATDLVPGDILRLRSGDRVPADVRLLEAVNLRIEESALTGESVLADKHIGPVEADATVGDRRCMAYSGTLVAAGRGMGVVTATGATTELGRISRMMAEVEGISTPLTRQMAAFGKRLSLVIIGMAAAMFLIGWLLYDFSLDALFSAAIGFAVAAIPEGLPAVMTITLAIGVQRMVQRHAITRRLAAVETLGSVTVICSDKTGTLTRNEMTVRHVVTKAGRYETEGIGYAPDGRVLSDGEETSLASRPDLQALVEVLAVCNDSRIAQEDGHWKVVGEPTEGALYTLGRKANFDPEPYQRIAIVPFESENKYMATLNEVPGKGLKTMLKGAPDRLLDRSAHERSASDALEPLDRKFWEEQIDWLSSQGLRVLAAASREVEPGKSDLTSADVDREMVFLGLVGIIDPPRPEAIEAIAACRQAGIRVKMITGDHAGTAIAIGREMGITENPRAVSGAELEAASDEDLRRIVRDSDIFARTSPEHKLRLVRALQANDEVVAMTGDGMNDAPALKQADVGVAMGIKGTEATKEAAEIVLTDDNFASIEHAVEEGRTIYDNLRKAIIFILPTCGAQAIVILSAVLLGLDLPLSPVQILWANLVTAVTLSLALAYEPAGPDVMNRPPRPPGASILGEYFLWRILFVSVVLGGVTITVFRFEEHRGYVTPVAQTVAVNTLVLGQLFYLFNCRFIRDSSLRLDALFTNRVVWIAVGLLVVFQVLFVYVPFLNSWFQSAPVTTVDWLLSIGIGLGIFLIVEAEKALFRRIKAIGAVSANREVITKSVP
jgi:magnesium-transporting ATPase (P-type)